MFPTTPVVVLLLLLGPGDVVDGSLVSSSRLQGQGFRNSAERRHLSPPQEVQAFAERRHLPPPQEVQAFAERSDTTSQELQEFVAATFQESQLIGERGHQLPQRAEMLAEKRYSPPQETQVFVERRYLPPQLFVHRGEVEEREPLVFREEPVPSGGPGSTWLSLLPQDTAQLLTARPGKLHPAAGTSSRRRGVVRQLPSPWYSADTWLAAFQSSFKRDMILNVGKVGAILLLYYLAPDLLVWINDNLGLE